MKTNKIMKQTDKKADLISESYKNYCENFDEGNFSKKWLKLEESFDGFFNNENYSVYTEEEFINKLNTDEEFSKRWKLTI